MCQALGQLEREKGRGWNHHNSHFEEKTAREEHRVQAQVVWVVVVYQCQSNDTITAQPIHETEITHPYS